eukprot:3089504-Rhodomonas_salina.2
MEQTASTEFTHADLYGAWCSVQPALRVPAARVPGLLPPYSRAMRCPVLTYRLLICDARF